MAVGMTGAYTPASHGQLAGQLAAPPSRTSGFMKRSTIGTHAAAAPLVGSRCSSRSGSMPPGASAANAIAAPRRSTQTARTLPLACQMLEACRIASRNAAAAAAKSKTTATSAAASTAAATAGAKLPSASASPAAPMPAARLAPEIQALLRCSGSPVVLKRGSRPSRPRLLTCRANSLTS